MSVFVKICGMTDEASLVAAIEAGADALGFVFYERSPRHMDVKKASELMSKVPGPVLRVAVMLHPDAEYCANVIAELQPDALQTDAADFDYLELPATITPWPVYRENLVGNADEMPARFLYEGATSGHGERVDWERAADIARRGEMILAGGLGIANVAEAVRTVRPWGVDVSSAVESSPGRKDARLIREFIAAAKAA